MKKKPIVQINKSSGETAMEVLVPEPITEETLAEEFKSD